MFALPAVTILAVTLVAALPAVIHAVRTDPVMTLRGDSRPSADEIGITKLNVANG